jgi:hypothetical protein
MESRPMIRKIAYGLVKQAVVEGHAAGMTYAKVAAKFCLRRDSLYTAAKRMGLSLKPSKHIK